MSRPLLLLTLGDPNGIGPEIALKAAARDDVRDAARLVAVGSAAGLADQAERLGLGRVQRIATLADAAGIAADVLPVLEPDGIAPDYTWGATTAAGGRAAWQALELAVDLCLDAAHPLAAGTPPAGIVTAPLSKEAVARAGVPFPGHTDYLAERADGQAVMVLASDLDAGPLRVALQTVHVPVAAVPELITSNAIQSTALHLAASLRADLGIGAPRIAVLGLNPHAGDGGVIGREDLDTVGPACDALRATGLEADGPFPADAFFGRQTWARYDATLAMYHDQGLAPFKALAMGGGVNVTLGLSLVRTSPDHGTGFDIAGRGIADANSLAEAVKLAAQIAEAREGSTLNTKDREGSTGSSQTMSSRSR